MPERKIKLVKWAACTTKGEYHLTEEEYRILLEADSKGARFVEFDNFTLNTAFITEIKKKVEFRSIFSPLELGLAEVLKSIPKTEMKFVSSNKTSEDRRIAL